MITFDSQKIDFSKTVGACVVPKNVTMNEQRTIGVFGPHFFDTDHSSIGEGIKSVARQAGCTLSFFNSYQSLESEQILSEEKLDGLIVFGGELKTKDKLLKLVAREIPLVTVQTGLSGTKVNCVYSNNTDGGYIATRHLIELGHTRIAHITGHLEQEFARERSKGYQNALDEAGLPLRPEWIVTGDLTCQGGYRAMRDLLNFDVRVSEGQQCSAVFIVNDNMAIGAMRAIREVGLSVPDDIAIIGYDDLDIAAWTSPSLTTVKQPRFKMGEEAMLILLSILNGRRKADEGIKISLIPELVVRDSTVSRTACQVV